MHVGGTIGMRPGARGFEPSRGTLETLLRSHPQICDLSYERLAMPVSQLGKRIEYDVVEHDPLLDSSNMNMRDWVRVAEEIGERYDEYDGFVVLHGTDTMAYAASALSFLLENLGKPVVLTGSQLPLVLPRNDAVDNLVGAMLVAGHFALPEVGLFFRNRLLRGNRAEKQDTASFDAFVSPKFPPLVHLGVDVEVRWDKSLPMPASPLVVHRAMDEHVGALRLFPGITAEIAKNFLRPPLRGLVLETYGSGNGPDDAALLAVFREATDRGVVIVNVTQCLKGEVTTSYATGRSLSDAGLISGGDMTPEAALMKLSFLFGKGLSAEDVTRAMLLDLRGERR